MTKLRETQIQIRVDEAEKKKVEKQARKEGFRTVSDYTRWLWFRKTA